MNLLKSWNMYLAKAFLSLLYPIRQKGFDRRNSSNIVTNEFFLNVQIPFSIFLSDLRTDRLDQIMQQRIIHIDENDSIFRLNCSNYWHNFSCIYKIIFISVSLLFYCYGKRNVESLIGVLFLYSNYYV